MFVLPPSEGPWMLAVIWIGQTTIVACASFVLIRILRKQSPYLHYAILLVAMLKFLIPPVVALPISLFAMAPLPGASSTTSIVPGSNAVPVSTGMRFSEAMQADESIAGGKPEVTLSPSIERARAPLMSWTNLAVAAYLIGLTGVSLRLAWRARQLRSAMRHSRPLADSATARDLCKILEQSRVGSKTRLLQCDGLRTPFACGLVRPAIVLPAWVGNDLSSSEQQWIVSHELRHIERFDVWIAWLQNLLTVIWWFHPAWWALNRRIRIVREESCDLSVTQTNPLQGREYALALLSAARCITRCDGMEIDLVPAVLSGNRSSLALESRVRRILEQPTNASSYKRWHGLVIASVMAIFVLPGTAPRADDRSAAPHEAARYSGHVFDSAGQPIVDAMVVTYPRVPGDRAISEEKQSNTLQVNFAGVEAISADQLRSLVTKALPLHNRSEIGKYLKEDVKRLVSFYHRKGFIHVSIDATCEHDNETEPVIVFRVKEGPKYRLSEVVVDKNGQVIKVVDQLNPDREIDEREIHLKQQMIRRTETNRKDRKPFFWDKPIPSRTVSKHVA